MIQKVLLFVGSVVLAAPLASGAQYATPRLMAADGSRPIEFDVMSVKPNHSGSTVMKIVSPPMSDGVTITNMPLENILQWAFGIFLNDQIAGLPDWARQERYDVTAKVSDEDAAAFRKVTDPIQRMPMLQKLLVERFHLTSHYAMKELPVYALVVGKNGIRMTEIQPAIGANGMKEGGARQVSRGQIKSMGQPMKPLINQLTMELGHVVVDRTGLMGYYNFTLKWTPDDASPTAGSVPEDPSAPSIFTAVQEQLGLKLEHARAPVQVLVIDHLEKPTEN
ncbi:TIGR03435 family protein [Bryocella elongata]|uniref:TIGR03435 family protein n=1 Tax=Bryocella elongata TaxID=863522 RepID=UPI0011B0173E|nr:TIGR03435 family protein [Bryocella elongata]